MRCNYPDDYDESWFNEEHPCSSCEDHENDKERLAAFFTELVDVLYHKENIPLFKLHDLIDEIGAYLGERNIPDHLPPVVRMNALGRELHNIPSSSIKKS
jgi:hypothetical protein